MNVWKDLQVAGKTNLEKERQKKKKEEEERKKETSKSQHLNQSRAQKSSTAL